MIIKEGGKSKWKKPISVKIVADNKIGMSRIFIFHEKSFYFLEEGEKIS